MAGAHDRPRDYPIVGSALTGRPRIRPCSLHGRGAVKTEEVDRADDLRSQVPDTVAEAFRPEHAALIVVDVQNDFRSPGGHAQWYGGDLSQIQRMIPTLCRLLCAARAAGIPPVLVQQTTLSNGLSDSPAWLFFKNRVGQDPGYTVQSSWGHAFVDGIAPLSHEPDRPKHRSSGFVRTTLASCCAPGRSRRCCL